MHKIALQFGNFTITWYGVFVASGFLFGLWTASRRALRENIAPEKIIDLGPWLLVGAIVGARFLYVVSYWRESFAGKDWWEIFMVHHGGLVFYGGLIGGSLGCVFYAWRKKIPLWKLGDVLAPSIPLGYFFGRFGCLMNGCCYGKACSLPWAITFPEGHETHPLGLPAIPVHPTQIYDSLLNLGLFAALVWLHRRKKFDGQIFATYLMCYAVTRSLVEMFRGDYTAMHYFAGLTPAQMVSIGIFLAGLILFFVLPLPQPPRAQAAQ